MFDRILEETCRKEFALYTVSLAGFEPSESRSGKVGRKRLSSNYARDLFRQARNAISKRLIALSPRNLRRSQTAWWSAPRPIYRVIHACLGDHASGHYTGNWDDNVRASVNEPLIPRES